MRKRGSNSHLHAHPDCPHGRGKQRDQEPLSREEAGARGWTGLPRPRHRPPPHALHLGVSPLHPGLCRSLRTSACPIMTILQMSKVRFRIGNYLAPDHLTSKRQICHLPAKSCPPRPQAGGGKRPPRRGKQWAWKEMRGGLRPPWPFWLPATAIPHPPCAHPGPAPPSCCLAGKSNSPCGQTLLLGPPQRFQIMKEP